MREEDIPRFLAGGRLDGGGLTKATIEQQIRDKNEATKLKERSCPMRVSSRARPCFPQPIGVGFIVLPKNIHHFWLCR
jgi:hypothetical protein